MNKKILFIVSTIVLIIMGGVCFLLTKYITAKNEDNINIVGAWEVAFIYVDDEEKSIYDVLGTIVKEVDPIITFNDDNTFVNYIGRYAGEEETPTQGKYGILKNDITLTYRNNTIEKIEYSNGTLKYHFDDHTIINLVESEEALITSGLLKGLSINKTYKKVLEGKERVVVGTKEMTFNNYIKDKDGSLSGLEKVNFNIEKYSTVDLDQDGSKELVFLLTNGSISMYAFLHYEDGRVYGYNFMNYRAYEEPKITGEYLSSGGASINSVNKLTFSKEKMIETEEASSNMIDGEVKITINKEAVDEIDYNKFMEDFNSKENIEFLFADKAYFKKTIVLEGIAEEVNVREETSDLGYTIEVEYELIEKDTIDKKDVYTYILDKNVQLTVEQTKCGEDTIKLNNNSCIKTTLVCESINPEYQEGICQRINEMISTIK